MVQRKTAIGIVLAAVAVLVIAGYAVSQPAPGTGPGLPPGASAAPPAAPAGPPGGPPPGGPPGGPPPGGPSAAAPTAAGPSGAPAAGDEGEAGKQAALSQSTPEEIKEGLRRALAMIASGQLEGRISEPYAPGVVSATYGVKTPQPVAVWVVRPPDPQDPPDLPPESRIDRQEAARVLRYFSLRYENPLSPWAERQKDFDLQIAGQLQRQINGLPPFTGAPPPPAVSAASAPAGGPAGAPAGGPPGAPPGAAPGAPPGGAPGAPPGPPPPPPM